MLLLMPGLEIVAGNGHEFTNCSQINATLGPSFAVPASAAHSGIPLVPLLSKIRFVAFSNVSDGSYAQISQLLVVFSRGSQVTSVTFLIGQQKTKFTILW